MEAVGARQLLDLADGVPQVRLGALAPSDGEQGGLVVGGVVIAPVGRRGGRDRLGRSIHGRNLQVGRNVSA